MSHFVLLCPLCLFSPSQMSHLVAQKSAGPMVNNPASNTGDVGLIPARGTKTPHVAEQLSPPTTREYVCRSKRPQVSQLGSDTAKQINIFLKI